MSSVVEEGRGGIDWWSRLISLGSLVVAGAALWFAYQTSERTPSRDEALALMKASINDAEKLAAADRRKQQQAFADSREQWQTAVDDQLQKWQQVTYRQPATPDSHPSDNGGHAKETHGLAANDSAAADKSEEPRNAAGVTPIADTIAQDALKSSELTTFEQPTPEESSSATGPPDEPPTNTTLSLFAADEAGEPDLRVVRTALKSDRGSIPTVSLRNAGTARAVITSVAFEPAEIVEVDEVLIGEWPRSAGPGQWLVRFVPTENMALIAGDQGAYFKQLPESQIVEPEEELQVVVAIADSLHAGWGMVGKLTLDFATSPSKTIDDVKLVFLASE